MDFEPRFIKNLGPHRFDALAYVPFSGASGGILVLWINNLFDGRILLEESFWLAINFTSHFSAENFTLVIVYGSCDRIDRVNFAAWLFHLNIEDDAL
jgi:hypothetical protein